MHERNVLEDVKVAARQRLLDNSISEKLNATTVNTAQFQAGNMLGRQTLCRTWREKSNSTETAGCRTAHHTACASSINLG